MKKRILRILLQLLLFCYEHPDIAKELEALKAQ